MRPNMQGVARRWRAHWIWASHDDGKVKNSYYYFRRSFCWDGSPGTPRLYITADSRYRLFVNGQMVGEGAPQSVPFFKYYDVYDNGLPLRCGENCIAVVVNYVGNMADTRGGLLAELVDEGGSVVLATDASWKAMRANAWSSNTYYFRMSQYTPYQEMYDARRVPPGWTEACFDDARWPQAVVLRGRYGDYPHSVPPWSYLVERDIPFMTARPQLPERIETVEESLSILNRMRSEDLSIGLSTPGRPLCYSRVEAVEDLLREGGITVVQNSTRHMDREFDGIYDPAIVLDFGRVITAFLELDVEGSAGGTIDIGYAERLFDGYFSNVVEGQFADRYVMTDGRQQYRPFTWKAFRYVKLRFRSCFTPVKVHSVRAIISTYPYEEKGSFVSSDIELNKVFGICRYTIRLCSNEFLMDTPWREQAQFSGDVAAVTLGGIYACFGDTMLPGKFLRQVAATQYSTGFVANISNTVSDWKGPLIDYSLWWVTAIWRHYLYTGEAQWVHWFYPHILKVIQAYAPYVNEHGLLENVPFGVFIDWADIDRRGECAALNAIFYHALDLVGSMAALRGDTYAQGYVEELRQGIARSFMSHFFHEGLGCFVDANIQGEQSPQTSEQTNVAAILWGLCDAVTAQSIIHRFYVSEGMKGSTEAQPFFSAFTLQALDKMGRFDLALEVIRKRWGRRMVAKGLTSTLEEWYNNGSWRAGEFAPILRTQSHAWSAHPAEFLIRSTIGLEILAPGCRKVRVHPREVPFDYDIHYPTPLGAIAVNKRGNDVSISVPDGMDLV